MKIRVGEESILFGKYPCNEYLNNAIRFLLDSESVEKDPKVVCAIRELCYCIDKAKGYFETENKRRLIETKIGPWEDATSYPDYEIWNIL